MLLTEINCFTLSVSVFNYSAFALCPMSLHQISPQILYQVWTIHLYTRNVFPYRISPVLHWITYHAVYITFFGHIFPYFLHLQRGSGYTSTITTFMPFLPISYFIFSALYFLHCVASTSSLGLTQKCPVREYLKVFVFFFSRMDLFGSHSN